VSTGNLQFYIDHSSFSGQDGKTYTEFYLMLFTDQLMNTDNKTDSVREFLVETSISDSSGEMIIPEKSWHTRALLPRDSKDPGIMVVYDQWAELMNPGLYYIKVKVSVKNPDQTGQAEETVIIPAFDSHTFSVSQIEFVSEVQNKRDNTPFMKGNRKIIPNPWRRYGALNTQLSFFYEVYNLPEAVNLTGEYTIRDNSGKIVKQLTDIQIANSSKNISVVHGINISGLPTGVYNLNINLSDSGNGTVISQSRTFEIIQLDSIISKHELTEEEAAIEGGLIKYLGSASEYELYSSLDLGGKARYIVNFWSELDPTPGTPENEFLLKVQERFLYSNANFTWGSTQGWKSDRGKILIEYGMPDNTDQHSAEAGMKNYEVWTYNQDKTFIFIFIDLRANGNYTLVHSTKEGEISDPNWKDYLR
jgi:GWxTD domain-containing protein